MFWNNEMSKFLSRVDAGNVETVYLLGLEAHDADPRWATSQKIINVLVSWFQPSPVMAHVEILIPPAKERDETHFSTYFGHTAGFGSAFEYSSFFYLGDVNSDHWRAVPIRASLLAQKLRHACSENVGCPYSITRYLFSVVPGRAAAGLLNDSAMAPAHCAGLSARVLKTASQDELRIPHSSPWYSPSTLYIEMTSTKRMLEYDRLTKEAEHVTSIAEQEESHGAVEVLLRGSDDSVAALDTRLCLLGVKSLSDSVVRQRASPHEQDSVRERILEKQLARGLLRWVQLQHPEGQKERNKWQLNMHTSSDTSSSDTPCPDTPTDTSSGRVLDHRAGVSPGCHLGQWPK